MNGFQWAVIFLCFVISLIDGFDVLVMAFTASAVADDWSLSGIDLGYLLSAAPIGMAFGSLFIAPLADRWGRRPLIIGCVAVVGAAMTGSAYAAHPLHLGLFRFSTGLGIGGVMASSYVIAGEFASLKWRSLAIGLQSAAFSLGAVVGGLISAQIIPSSGWRAVFLYGGLATLSVLPAISIWLPESIDFLISRKSTASLDRINQLLKKLGLSPLEVLHLPQTREKRVKSYFGNLLGRDLRTSTLLIWASFFLAFLGFYFIFSWTPRLLATSGLSASQAIFGGVLLNVGGFFGAMAVGLLATRFRLDRVLMLCMVLTALLMILTANFLSSYLFAAATILFIGFFANGSIAGLYALTPVLYRPDHRVTGLGCAIGVGRLGAILAPAFTGALIASHWQPPSLFLLFSIFFFLAAVLVAVIKNRSAPIRIAGSFRHPAA